MKMLLFYEIAHHFICVSSEIKYCPEIDQKKEKERNCDMIHSELNSSAWV